MGLTATLLGGNTGADGIPSGRFRDLFNQSGPLASNISQQLSGFAPGLGTNLANQGQQFLGQLPNSGASLLPFMQPGFGAAQIGGLASILNQNFQEQISPFIKSQAVGAGQLGGSRQVQELLQQAELNVNRPLVQQAGNILQSDLFRRQQAAGQFGQQQLAGNLGGLQSLQAPLNVAMAGFNAPLSPLATQAGLLASMPQRQQMTGGLLPAVSDLASFNFFPGSGGGGGVPT